MTQTDRKRKTRKEGSINACPHRHAALLFFTPPWKNTYIERGGGEQAGSLLQDIPSTVQYCLPLLSSPFAQTDRMPSAPQKLARKEETKEGAWPTYCRYCSVGRKNERGHIVESAFNQSISQWPKPTKRSRQKDRQRA